MYQMIIPDDLSETRYISGMAALNLPTPEGTSGDWHFLNLFFREDRARIRRIFVAGEGEKINTNHIFGSYGIYRCEESLKKRGLFSEGRPHAANHFRAILDLLYQSVNEGDYPRHLQGSSEDYLDTNEEKTLLFDKTMIMLPHLGIKQQSTLLAWLEVEKKSGYRA
jgi:hypothetical protein